MRTLVLDARPAVGWSYILNNKQYGYNDTARKRNKDDVGFCCKTKRRLFLKTAGPPKTCSHAPTCPHMSALAHTTTKRKRKRVRNIVASFVSKLNGSGQKFAPQRPPLCAASCEGRSHGVQRGNDCWQASFTFDTTDATCVCSQGSVLLTTCPHMSKNAHVC